MKVLLSSFHLIGHTLGFNPKTEQYERQYLTSNLFLGWGRLEHVNVRT